MKKVISLLLVCLMMLSMVTVVSAVEIIESGEYVTVTLTDGKTDNQVNATGVTDSTTVIPVKIRLDKLPESVTENANFGITAVGIDVKFDKTKLQLAEPATTVAMKQRMEVADMSIPATWVAPKSNDGTLASANSTGAFTVSLLSSAGTSFTTGDHTENPVLIELNFTKVEGAKGVAEVELTKFEMDNNTGDDATNKQWKTGYFNLTPCDVVLTNVYSATIGEYDEEKGNVSIAIAGDKNPEELDTGDVVTITATPEDGYEVDKIFVNGSEIVGNTYTIDDVSAVITATFKAKNYAITYEAEADVTSWGGPDNANYGDVVTVTPVTKNSQYVLSNFKVNEGAVEVQQSGASYTFTMPAGPVNITADVNFEAGNRSVAFGANEGFESNLGASYPEKSKVAFTVNLKDGYQYKAGLAKVTADNAEVTEVAEGSYEFTMPEGMDVVVTVNVEKIPYELATTINYSGVNGTVRFEKATAVLGEVVKFQVTPAEGKSITGITATGSNSSTIDVTKLDSLLFGVDKAYSFVMPADGVVTLASTDASDAAELTSVEVSYTGLDKNDASTGENDKYTETATVDTITTFGNNNINTLSKYTTGNLTLKANVSAGATAQILYNGTEYNNDQVAESAAKTFTVKVKAADNETEKEYTVRIKNNVDPLMAASVQFKDAALSVAKGSEYVFDIVAAGYGANMAKGFDMEVTLPVEIIANAENPFAVSILPGNEIASAYRNIEYIYTAANEAEGTAASGKLKIVVSSLDGNYFSDPVTIGTISFMVVGETTATEFKLGADDDKAQYGGVELAATNMTVLSTAVELTESEETVKAAAIAEIEALAKYTDYTMQEWETVVEPIIVEAIARVEVAENDQDAIDEIVDWAEEEIAKAQILGTVNDNGTPDDLTDDTINEANSFKGSIATADNINKKVEADYLTDDWATIEKITEDAIDTIIASGSRDEDVLNGYVTDAQAKIDEVPTLADRKTEAKAEIVVDKTLYITEANDALDAAVQAAYNAIDAAENAEDLDKAKTDFDAAIDALATELLTVVRAENNLDVSELVNGGTINDGNGADSTYPEATVTALDKTKYTADNWDKIEIYQSIANAKINAATSEAAMDAAVAEAQAKIAAVATIADAQADALKKINEAEDENGYDIEDIIDTGVTGVNPVLETLYEAEIENDKPLENKEELQEIINKVNTINGRTGEDYLAGDFTVNKVVDIADPTGAITYICAKELNYAVTAQGIVNADLYGPKDGVLTVFDVVEILDLL